VKFDAGAKVMVTLSKSRIEALSDGVFSIAMTLLVLKLEVPEVMHHASNDQMLQQLFKFAAVFVTYVVTFLIAGGFWFLHHLTFHFIRHVDSFLVWVNLMFSDAGGAAAVFGRTDEPLRDPPCFSIVLLREPARNCGAAQRALAVCEAAADADRLGGEGLGAAQLSGGPYRSDFRGVYVVAALFSDV